MGDLISFRNARKRRGSRWAKPEAYRRSTANLLSPTTHEFRARWFPLALVTLPLAAGSAVLIAPQIGDGIAADAAIVIHQVADSENAHFPICGSGPRVTCVVDGDTIWYQGIKIRLADIDTPEVSKPGCANEARLGRKATRQLQQALNAGPFSVVHDPQRKDTDKYGRALRTVTRDGVSLGEALVDAGLAERWGGARIEWC